MAQSTSEETTQFEEEAKELRELSENIKQDMMKMMLTILDGFQDVANSCSPRCAQRLEVLRQDMLHARDQRRSDKNSTKHVSMNDQLEETSQIRDEKAWALHLDRTPVPYSLDDWCWEYDTPPPTSRHNNSPQCTAMSAIAGFAFAPTDPATNANFPPVPWLPPQPAIKRSTQKKTPRGSTSARVAYLEKVLANERRRHKQFVEDTHEKFKNLQHQLDQGAMPCPIEPIAPSAFQVGDKVECFSLSQKRWCNACVREVRANSIIVDYGQKNSKGNRVLKGLPLGHRHLRHADASIATSVPAPSGVS